MSRDFASVGAAARGRWPGILQALGVDPRYLKDEHGPCPVCGGKDRYRFDDKGDGRFYCSRCGPGDGFTLVERVLNLSRAEALRRVSALVMGPNAPAVVSPPETAAAEARKAAAALARLKATVAELQELRPGDLVTRYLAGRGLPVRLRRYRGLYYHPDTVGKGLRGPAMVAKVVDPVTHRVRTLHRTFLTPEGTKVADAEPKQIMPVAKTARARTWLGCAVRLYDLSDKLPGALVVAEGIETALAAAELFLRPAWATLTAGGLAAWEPPEGLGIRDVLIAADHDESGVGQAAAHELAGRLWKRGIRASVEVPTEPGTDWLDVYVAE
ncbi:MAG TPA: toprim domain-containing protein, partial [Longimicrobiales bacterium]